MIAGQMQFIPSPAAGRQLPAVRAAGTDQSVSFGRLGAPDLRRDRPRGRTLPAMSDFQHLPHPWIHQRRQVGPAQVDDERVGFGAALGARITAIVGTMMCALAFTILALISLPSAIKSRDLLLIIGWIAQTFLQLVLLPIIIVGQNVQGRAADKRAVQTYQDAEAILHECLQLQAHLMEQDKILQSLIGGAGGGAPGAAAG
jgi:hypothetical protein